MARANLIGLQWSESVLGKLFDRAPFRAFLDGAGTEDPFWGPFCKVFESRWPHQLLFYRHSLKSCIDFGVDTGDLWRWSKQTGPQLLPGTTANQPNGLEISPDERHVFANMYVTQELWKVDVDTGEIVDVAAVANADNSAWSSDGRL